MRQQHKIASHATSASKHLMKAGKHMAKLALNAGVDAVKSEGKKYVKGAVKTAVSKGVQYMMS